MGRTHKTVKFDLRSLAVMDGGRMSAVFNQALARCLFDLSDRPGVGGARSLTLKVNMTPVQDEGGELHSIDVTFDVKDTIPKRGTQRYNMVVGAEGAVYNDLSPDDYRQLRLPFDEPEVLAGGRQDEEEYDDTEDEADVG